jgi:hypothetical protein
LCRDPEERPTADTLTRHSPFGASDPLYDFRKTDLFARLSREEDVSPRRPDTNTLSISQPQQRSEGPNPQLDAAPEVGSIRPPTDDEHTVMKRFTSHASRCTICNDPYAAYTKDIPLCSRGNALAKDIGHYIYAGEGKPYSISDRKRGERIQIQIPVGMDVISLLLKAVEQGLSSTQRKKPMVAWRTENPAEAGYQQGDVEVVEIVPVSSRSHRKEKVPETEQLSRQGDVTASRQTSTATPSPSERENTKSPLRHSTEMEPGLAQQPELRRELAESFKGSRIRRGNGQRTPRPEVISSESELGDEEFSSTSTGTVLSKAASLVDDTEGIAKFTSEREVVVEASGEDDIDVLLLEWTTLSTEELKV